MANNTITAKIAVVEDNTEDMMWMTAAVQEVFPFAQMFSSPINSLLFLKHFSSFLL